MKPNFALSLSFDGIRLLRRAAGGWRAVGDVALDAADMAGELGVLRKTASSLEPGGVRVKILLPNEQIKYLTIDTAGLSDAERDYAARAALDGATPYAVDDLVFDTAADGEETHIAAVARETLDEAEAFAVEHRFHPVCFAAVPGDQPYLGEPYFGPTKAAAELIEDGEKVEPDGIAVVVVGDLDTAPEPELESTKEPAPGPEPVEEATTEDAPSEPNDDVKAKGDAPEPAEDIKPEMAAEEEDAEQQPVVAAKSADKPDDIPSLDDAPEEPEEKTLPDPLVLGGALRDAPKTPAPEVPPATGFSSRRGSRKLRATAEATRREPALGPATPVPAAASVTAAKIDVEPDTPAPLVADPKPKSGFLSRRRPGKVPPAPPALAAGPATAVPAMANGPDGSEEDRMTIFGARRRDVGGKPRFLGLILTAALLIFLAGVAAWASVFLDDGISLSRLFGEREPVVASQPAEPEQPETPTEEPILTTALDPTLSDEDAAVLDAMRAPILPEVQELTDDQIEAQYAVTGIWPKAPVVPPEPPGLIDLDDLYLTGIDPISTASDAVALPAADTFRTDVILAAVSNPVAAGTDFALDARGLIIPTPEGAISPDGVVVFLGRPPVVPPAIPTRFQTEPEDTAVREAIAAFRPRIRPGDLAETNERAQFGGLTRSELAGLRPALRPQSQQQQAEEAAPQVQPVDPADTDNAVTAALAAVPAIENATKYATRASLRPDTRPRNFSRIVKRAQRSAPAEEVRVASAAVAPRTVSPKIPSKASVSRQATVKNAINLRKVNLIGVYGKPSSRRALVRLSSGRYKKVVVGDRLDGGRVSAIGDSELRYTKSGRSLVLKMPR